MRSAKKMDHSRISPAGERLFRQFPQFFPQVITPTIKLPEGWLPYVLAVFEKFSLTGLDITIYKMDIKSGKLTVQTSNMHPGYGGEFILNSLLEKTRHICPVCGNRIESGGKSFLCGNCANNILAPRI